MKIILKKTGEEIQMGQTLSLLFVSPHGQFVTPVKVGTDNMVQLQQMNIIEVILEAEKEVSIKPEVQQPKTIVDIVMDPMFYLDSFEDSPVSDDMAQGGMEFLLMMHIAVLIDQRYPRNIKDSKEIYWCNPTNGKIEQLDKVKVKNFNKFPAFRSKEDAIAALKIMSSIRKITKENA